jgi:hypothetical protein
MTYVDLLADPAFLGKYTKTDAGQKKFDGWSVEKFCVNLFRRN